MNKHIRRGVTLAVTVSIAALGLSACGTAGSGFKTTDYGATGRLTVEQSSAPRTTRNYMVDTVTGYDEDGHKNPPRELTIEESIMVAETDLYCANRASEVEGLATEYLANGVAFTALGAVGQAAGALGVPGADLSSYASLGGGSFGASSIATSRLMIRQSLTILHATCMQTQLSKSGDHRVREIAIYPVISGVALRPKTGRVHSETEDQRATRLANEGRTESEVVTTTTIPLTGF